jgi:hypothetical protein
MTSCLKRPGASRGLSAGGSPTGHLPVSALYAAPWRSPALSKHARANEDFLVTAASSVIRRAKRSWQPLRASTPHHSVSQESQEDTQSSDYLKRQHLTHSFQIDWNPRPQCSNACSFPRTSDTVQANGPVSECRSLPPKPSLTTLLDCLFIPFAQTTPELARSRSLPRSHRWSGPSTTRRQSSN